MNEWRPVVGFVGRYDVSRSGHVRRWRGARGIVLKNPLPLVGEIDKGGYHKVVLRAGKIMLRIYVHKLIAGAFIGRAPAGKQVKHISGVRADNLAVNLEYVTKRGRACQTSS
jgi:HNH endonuclease